MKNNSKTTFIIVAGIIVLVVFTTVLSINLLPNYESNSYFVKVGDEMSLEEYLNDVIGMILKNSIMVNQYIQRILFLTCSKKEKGSF